MILPDVGLWLSAVWGRHVHNRIAAPWFGRQTDDLLLCRVTQMSLLRLLSNATIMGDDVLTRSAAWRIVDQLRADERVRWADEPAELDAVWRTLSARDDTSHKLWTDDYLAAFAQAAGATLATLDRKMARRYPSVQVEHLIPAHTAASPGKLPADRILAYRDEESQVTLVVDASTVVRPEAAHPLPTPALAPGELRRAVPPGEIG